LSASVDGRAFLIMIGAVEITFQVEPCKVTGGFVARWDDPHGGGITTQGDTLAELQSMVADAVSGYFDAGEAPTRVRLHFAQDPVFAVA
jgi:predicted RNase H-like HicB family nuclease